MTHLYSSGGVIHGTVGMGLTGGILESSDGLMAFSGRRRCKRAKKAHFHFGIRHTYLKLPQIRPELPLRLLLGFLLLLQTVVILLEVIVQLLKPGLVFQELASLGVPALFRLGRLEMGK